VLQCIPIRSFRVPGTFFLLPNRSTNVSEGETPKSPLLRADSFINTLRIGYISVTSLQAVYAKVRKGRRLRAVESVRSSFRGVLISEQIEVPGEARKPYQARQLKEYGNLGQLTLGGSGINMDNPLGMGVFSTKT
jgi:hypothetical protein